jgi:hypothetical protein
MISAVACRERISVAFRLWSVQGQTRGKEMQLLCANMSLLLLCVLTSRNLA